jgi:hypothetical protein
MARGLTAVAVAFLVACGDPAALPTTGSLEISSITREPRLDLDGYLVRIDGGAGRQLQDQQPMMVADMAPGDHALELSGVAQDCTVGGENPRTAAVTAGGVARVRFDISCSPTTGSIEVRTATTGPPANPAGYRLAISGARPRALASTGVALITGLAPGTYDLELQGNNAECPIADGPTRMASVDVGDTTVISYEIRCDLAVGAVVVVTETSGESPDDAYLIRMDSAAAGTVAGRDSVTLDGVTVGRHEIQLDGITDNCAVDGPGSVGLQVANRRVERVAFRVTCVTPGTGSLVVTLATQVINWPGFQGTFSVMVDDGAAQSIPLNGSVTIRSLPAGEHSVLLRLPGSCSVGGFFGPHTNPQPVTVTAAGTATVRFSVLCIG